MALTVKSPSMKKTIKFILFLILSLVHYPPSLYSQTEGPKEDNRFYLEIDPLTFAFGGYSAHLRLQPKRNDKLLLGAGIYAMNLPDFMIDLKKENQNKGWQSRLDLGLGLFAEHHFSQVNKGFFLGGQIGFQQYKVELENFPGYDDYSHLLFMGYGGYSLPISQTRFYLKFWGGLGYAPRIYGDAIRGSETYVAPRLLPFGTLHLGYPF